LIQRKPRSDSYQHILQEVQVTTELMENFTKDRSIGSILNPFKYNERVLDIQDELKCRFLILAELNCSKRQFEIIQLLLKNKTQEEIGNILKINQSSVQKSIYGNDSYYRNLKGERLIYKVGGIVKKLKKAIADDEQCQKLFNELSEIIEEDF
jgi:hypothetical protein